MPDENLETQIANKQGKQTALNAEKNKISSRPSDVKKQLRILKLEITSQLLNNYRLCSRDR